MERDSGVLKSSIRLDLYVAHSPPYTTYPKGRTAKKAGRFCASPQIPNKIFIEEVYRTNNASYSENATTIQIHPANTLLTQSWLELRAHLSSTSRHRGRARRLGGRTLISPMFKMDLSTFEMRSSPGTSYKILLRSRTC